MPRWHNPALTVYHGTDSTALGSPPLALALGRTISFTANLSLCRPFTDFGQGFYVTTNRHQARQWANAKVDRTPSPASSAVVLRFRIDRDALAALEALCFVRAIRDFWNLVYDCRNGFVPHQRTVAPPRTTAYDIVYGPVTLWPSILLIQDCDQIGFHTPNSLTHLTPNPLVVDYAPRDPVTGLGGKFPP